MINSSGSRGFLSGSQGPPIVAAMVTGLVVFVACFMVWYHLGGGAWRGQVGVIDANLRTPDELVFSVASCNGVPRATLLETEIDVQVKVVAYSTPLLGGEACADSVGPMRLQEPLGNRVVIDTHTGRVVLNRAEVELDSHLTLWKQARMSDYSYEYNVLCECSDNFGQPVRVSVTNGQARSVVYAESGAHVGSPHYHTVNSLFDLIQDAIDDEADLVTVSYDGEFGYPTNIEIDYSSNSVDGEYTLTSYAFSLR